MSCTRSRPAPAQAGFTIIEVLIAMLLLTIALAGTMALQLTALRAAQDSKQSTIASAIAQDRLEQFRAVTLTQLATMVTPDVTDTAAYFNAQGTPVTASDPFLFTRNATINPTPNPPLVPAPLSPPPVVVLQVEVTWATATRQERLVARMERNP